MKSPEFVQLRRLVTKELEDLPITADDLFRKGTLLMYAGQQLAALAGHQLSPGSLEYRKLLSDLVALLEMPTIEAPEIIGQHITEPNELTQIK